MNGRKGRAAVGDEQQAVGLLLLRRVANSGRSMSCCGRSGRNSDVALREVEDERWRVESVRLEVGDERRAGDRVLLPRWANSAAEVAPLELGIEPLPRDLVLLGPGAQRGDTRGNRASAHSS